MSDFVKSWGKSLNAKSKSLEAVAKREWGIKKDGTISKAWLEKTAKKDSITWTRAKILLTHS